ncbi:MAG: pyruvate dehydrogenase (acetyl-transferring), homodimeric type, partial [Bdellovibrionales bacterium]|nr:pyruvate dehydrogenase (acetyl-transferring), homodimeric type [Bdellovibrionales bacterium]
MKAQTRNTETMTTNFDIELQEWLESLKAVIDAEGTDRAAYLLEHLVAYGQKFGLRDFSLTTPYINTIPPEEQPEYPGNLALEKKISAIIRWNAIAMVLRANKKEDGIGGHISTYASSAVLHEIGFNHFFRGKDSPDADFIYFQGHASPGIYARAFLEGRISETLVDNFRREMAAGGGLSSYPHPQLMPDFWEFPTVSMGIGGLTAIYHARFIRYLENRQLKTPSDSKVWCFMGDGEMDEPESIGALSLASRENLDNLIFVVNCNLQRLDGPVRGNGKIIQELEGIFKGAGWNVIKVVWDTSWDALLANDAQGKLVHRLTEMLDGHYQKHVVSDGAFIRGDITQGDTDLTRLFDSMSDEQVKNLGRGGHDWNKVYAAYHRATTHKGAPTVILVKTVKGFGMGESGEGKNVAHQQKKMKLEDLRDFSTRFNLNLSDQDLEKLSFIKPKKDSPEIQYLLEQRSKLKGFVPKRSAHRSKKLKAPPRSNYEEFYSGTKDREVSTTMAFVKMLSNLIKDKDIGKYIVPIIPDEARTFGMESMFRQIGIYAPSGQLYEPVDKKNLLYYKEAQDGQILEEGITEAGSMSSFMAAGTAYANHGIPMMPFYIFYSMFGLQRIGDFAWAASDQQCKGFLLGATAGRTTLSGEGLQHQDGHSHVLALPIPTLKAYDPAYAYEIAVILEDGIHRMYIDGEDTFYYLTLGNENYVQP